MRKSPRLAMLLAPLLAALALGWILTPGRAYVEAPLSLGAVLAQSSNVVLVRVVSVDKKNNLIVYRKVQDVKGKHNGDLIKHNIGRGGLRPNEWKPPIDWAEPGKLAVFFYNGGASETCIGNWWYQAYAGGEYWNHSHGEPFLLRSYAGPPEKLVGIVQQMLSGKEVVVPCMIDGNKEDLHKRRGKIQRLKASLKLQDYNPKRDFVGWGGEDFRRLAGMPGFSHVSALGRVDPDAQAISVVDINGDGKQDLCLVGGGRVMLLQNGGDSMNEVLLPGVTGARAAVWADFNGDSRPDLLLATPHGLRLFVNSAGGLHDATHLLPAEASGTPAMAAAWIDHDGDGKPDLLVAQGYRGLRLYRNTLTLDGLVKELENANVPQRDKATATLARIGIAAEAALTRALAMRKSAVLQQQTVQLQQRWKNPTPPKPGMPEVPIPNWFEDVSVRVGLGLGGLGADRKGDSLTICDVNGDGLPDFLYGAGGGLLALAAKGGAGVTFTDATKSWGVSFSTGRVSPAFGDYDGDGRPDLVVPQKGGVKLFHNDGKGRLIDVTVKAGLGSFGGWATSACWGDFDNDGHLDLLLGCFRDCNRLFRGKGDGTFEDVSDAVGLTQKRYNSHAVALVDLNNDGSLDAVFNNEGQESVVLLGSPRAGKRVPVALTVAGSAGVLGSRVEVRSSAGRLLGSCYLSGGEGRGGQSAPIARFALTPGTYTVQVRLSSGQLRTQNLTVGTDPVRTQIAALPKAD